MSNTKWGTAFHSHLWSPPVTLGEVSPLSLEGPNQQAGIWFFCSGALPPRTDLCCALPCESSWNNPTQLLMPLASLHYYCSAVPFLLSLFISVPVSGVEWPHHCSHLFWNHVTSLDPLSLYSPPAFMLCTWALWQTLLSGTLLDFWETVVPNTCTVHE